MGVLAAKDDCFNPRARAWARPAAPEVMHKLIRRFNPRARAWARLPAVSHPTNPRRFNPRARAWARRHCIRLGITQKSFNPRARAWARQLHTKSVHRIILVSIHAPVRGRDTVREYQS